MARRLRLLATLGLLAWLCSMPTAHAELDTYVFYQHCPGPYNTCTSCCIEVVPESDDWECLTLCPTYTDGCGRAPFQMVDSYYRVAYVPNYGIIGVPYIPYPFLAQQNITVWPAC